MIPAKHSGIIVQYFALYCRQPVCNPERFIAYRIYLSVCLSGCLSVCLSVWGLEHIGFSEVIREHSISVSLCHCVCVCVCVCVCACVCVCVSTSSHVLSVSTSIHLPIYRIIFLFISHCGGGVGGLESHPLIKQMGSACFKRNKLQCQQILPNGGCSEVIYVTVRQIM